MRSLASLSIGLIAISLALPLWSAFNLIAFVQPERAQIQAGELHYMFTYENFVHEVGFGRFAISVIALFILFIPYRKRERWAFLALAILAVAYYVPVFLFGGIPNLGTWPAFQHWHTPELKVTNIALQYWTTLLLTAFLILGLAMSVPAFFKRKDN